MNNLEKKLSSYEDFELAYLVKYKLDSYMNERQEIVFKHIKSRGLTPDKLKSLVSQYDRKELWDTKKRCPRCKSSKLQSRKVVPKSGNRGMYDAAANLRFEESKVEETICMVCGFMVDNPNGENWNRPALGERNKKKGLLARFSDFIKFWA
jgi:predicted Zn-ribbon and HTH transcriptional regulator